MIAALLVLLVGVTDIIRVGRTGPVVWTLYSVVSAGFVALAVGGFDVPWLLALGCVAATVLWSLTMPGEDPRSGGRGLWPIAVFTALVVAAIAYDRVVPASGGELGALIGDLVPAAAPQLQASTVVAIIAALVFLTKSSNLIVRTALGRSLADDEGSTVGDTDDTSGWDLRVGRRVWATARPAKPSAPSSAEPALRGGRLIGPLERILIVILAFGGAYPVIAALLAAKGIVRFPEISADRGVGSKAEEFLVGSLTSWSLSAAAFGLIVVAATV